MGNCQTTSSAQILYAVSTNNQDKAPNETHIYRHPQAIGKDLSSFSKLRTLHDVYARRLKLRPGHSVFGRREKDSKGQLADRITWYSNSYVLSEAEALGSGMLNLKLVQSITEWKDMTLTFAGIYSKNSLEYMIFDIGCSMHGITLVPIYDTLGEEATLFAFSQTKMPVCAITASHAEKMLAQQKANNTFQYVRHLIIFDPENLPVGLKGVSEVSGIKLWTFEQVKDAGKKGIRAWAPITADSIYAFSYTSGTTGEPKGAMISHGNIVSVFPGAEDRFKGNEDDLYVSYLPLAHVMERVALNFYFSCDVKICFYSGDVLKLKEDLAVFRPTIFFSVPRLYNRFYEAIQTGIKEKSPFAQRLVARGLRAKYANLAQSCSYRHCLYDGLVFKKMREALGGRVRCMLTGSAPINEEALRFLKVAFSAPILEGYGQTEGTALEFATVLNDPLGGHVGGPALHNEFKLVDAPEMNYRSTDLDENGESRPRGEVWVRGPNVIRGYYKMDDKNAESFTKDGWLMSGDIAMLLGKEKRLKIVDRRKNIFKLSQGEYIAPEKLENIYKMAHPLITLLFVYGDSLKNCIVAVVSIEAGNIKKLARELNVPDADVQSLAESEEMKKRVIGLFDATAKEAKLNSLERLKAIHIETRPFGELKLLTEAFKVKRVDTRDFYKDVFEAMYAKLN